MEFSPLAKRVFILSGILVASCTPTQSDINQYTFKCFESGSTTNPVNTKLAGESFNISLVSYKNGAITSLTTDIINQLGTMTLGFVEATTQSSCEAAAPNALLSDAVTPALNLVGGLSSFNINGIRIDKAHKNVMCRVNLANYNPKCSDASFSVRPKAFTLDGSANLSTPDANGTTKYIADTDFTLAVKSVEANSGLGYNGIPTIANKCLIRDHNAIGTNNGLLKQGNTVLNPVAGCVAGAFPLQTASSGLSNNTFRYTEVGYLKIPAANLIDNTFTEADRLANRCIANSASNTLSGGKYGCVIANQSDLYFGRFIPNGFKATPVTITEGCDAGNFTYFGGRLTTLFDLEAVNASNNRTLNYTGSFAKFATVPLSGSAPSNIFNNYGIANTSLKNQDLITVNPNWTIKLKEATAPTVINNWSNGTARVQIGLEIAALKSGITPQEFARPEPPIVAQTINVSALPTDGEATTASATNIVNNTELRYGRASVSNAYGAETMPLTFDVLAQYYDTTGKWVTNVADNCTSLLPTAFSTSFSGGAGNNLTDAYKTNGWLTNVGGFAAGKGKFKLKAPGHGNNGWFTLTTPVVTELGGAQSMRASFGQYKSALIYSREN